MVSLSQRSEMLSTWCLTLRQNERTISFHIGFTEKYYNAVLTQDTVLYLMTNTYRSCSGFPMTADICNRLLVIESCSELAQ